MLIFILLTCILPMGTVAAAEIDTTLVTETASYATFETDTGLMRIPAVDLPNGAGGVDVYEVDLKLTDTNPVTFELADFALVQEPAAGAHAVYDPAAQTLNLPGVYVPGASGTQVFQVSLVLLPDTNPLQLTLADFKKLPYFPGIALLTPTAVDSMKLAWLPVTQSDTPEAEIVYEIHLGQTPRFVPEGDTLYAALTGKTQYELTGLTADTAYSILIVAKDEAGNRSLERDYRSAKTMTKPAVLRADTPLENAAALNLGEPVINGAEYVFQNAETASPPQTGSILAGNDGAYLRRIDSVKITGSGLVAQTSDASLSDAVEQAEISTSVLLFDVDQAAASPRLRTSAQSGKRRIDGSRHSAVTWENGLLRAEKISHAVEEAQYSQSPGEAPGAYAVRIANRQGEVTQSMELQAAVSFKPELITEAVWDASLLGGINIQRAQIKARGTLTLDANAAYNFSAAGRFEKEIPFPFFTAVYYAYYVIPVVPPIPVYQKITFTLDAVISAEAFSEIQARADTHASAFIEFGVVYDPVTRRWRPVHDQGLEHALTATLTVKGGVQAQVRLIPNIEVKFYEILAANLSAEPFVNGDIQAESITNADLLAGSVLAATQMTAFDFSLGLECFVSADLDILVRDISLLDKTRICSTPAYPLFDLPVLTLAGDRDSANVGETVRLTANVQDGTRNPFNRASVRWDVFPDNGGLSFDPANPLVADFSPTIAGEYVVFFSGHGALGELGRRFAQVSILALASDAPANLFAAVGNGQVTLSWDAVPGATSYNIYWIHEGAGEQIIGPVDSNGYTHTGLSNGVLYTYRVTAITGEAESPPSEPVSAMPTEADPLESSMVWIPGGTFRMGDIQGLGDSNEQPVHSVTVTGFFMGVYEVTNAEYVTFLNSVNRRGTAEEPWFDTKTEDSDSRIIGTTGAFQVEAGYENHPVVEVSWYGATAYTEWLSARTGNAYRLPTEAEWEYAARAGTETAYWWGNEIGTDNANCYSSFCGDSFSRTAPVGSFSASPFGLYDMAGNVWEWTCSEYVSSYSGAEELCKNDANRYVPRGGGWLFSAYYLRSAIRDGLSSDSRNSSDGFRVVFR
ncbi:MAG: SUMF1/EgtB/PvdO family nonheme iron enzyme [Gammaproteobacteria bacterium]|nr:SUMF1/EgtB/PvdO family nonheme iron enzyme [Gammaproteobacteria bacterium]